MWLWSAARRCQLCQYVQGYGVTISSRMSCTLLSSMTWRGCYVLYPALSAIIVLCSTVNVWVLHSMGKPEGLVTGPRRTGWAPGCAVTCNPCSCWHLVCAVMDEFSRFQPLVAMTTCGLLIDAWQLLYP
jgi:hypothetical protein